VIPQSTPPVDSRDTNALLAEFENRRPGYVPAWNPPAKSAGAAMGPIVARFLSAILQRLNQSPAKNKLAFLDLLGLRLVPAQPARVPIVFTLTQGSASTSAPEGTQVAAPPPPGSSQQIVFSTEQDAAVAAATLTEVVSLWPGRDQYINHSAAFAAGQPFTLFQNLQLTQTDHILYLAHSKSLAFAGTAHLKLSFDLLQGSSSPLDIAWEYWDGQVWRGFITYQASCLDPAEGGHDGTNGLSTSGSVQLDTEGAQTSQTTVNGVTSYWIRGRLTQALLPDPNQLLPETETIRLFTQIDRRLEFKIGVGLAVSTTGPNTVVVVDECGQALHGAVFTIGDAASGSILATGTMEGSDTKGDPKPISVSLNLLTNNSYQFTVSSFGISGTAYALYNLGSEYAAITLTVKVEGLSPDKAYSDETTLDVTKAFYPLSQAPAPGSTFYFKQTETFSKPGANVTIYLDPVTQDYTDDPVPHTINWEYWNGYEWSALAVSASPASHPHSRLDFTKRGIIQFTVPPDMVATTVNNDAGLWMRVRLATGGYGLQVSITLPPLSTPATINYTKPQPPIVAVFSFGYSWTQGPYSLESVMTFNDFQYQDHTSDARWPGNPFTPYQPVGDVTPALYLGFDKQLPVNNLGMYFDIVEQAGESSGPAMVWEYWNGGGWEGIAAEDETQQLALSGMVTVIPAADSQPLPRFDNPLYWIRGRLKEDGPPDETGIDNIYPNAVWASQWQPYTNSPLGVSTGVPNQIFQFNQIPILPGQEIEVQELSAPRANTEWRTVAMQVIPDDPNIVTELESLLAAEGPQTDIVVGNVHLVRDKTKNVVAVWIQWEERENFFDAGPDDRVYVLDHAMGRLFFGDGDAGMIAPLGSAIQGTSFRSGGGVAGNVTEGTITQLLGAVSGVQGVTNPRAAEGGADGETLDEFRLRAPSMIRNRGRAIVPADYEAMAQEATAGVAVARAIPTLDPSGVSVPGWVTLMIIPKSQDPRPVPSAGLRQDVLNYLLQCAPAEVALAQRINVVGPTYLPVDVTAALAPSDPAEVGAVEQNALAALAEFLNPLSGGPGGLGWDVGRGLYVSDIAGVLGNVDGVDYVVELALYVNGVLQGDQVQVPPGQIVVAGQFTVSMVLPQGG
jgi:uncharacterized phage protein gp47/JayE